jgi:hypothetical protein
VTHRSVAPFVLLLALLPGCISLSTFQSPRVLDPGEGQIGAGILFGVDLEGEESGLGELSILGRYGVGERVDVGGKIWGFPPFLGIYADVRYQLLREPLLVSGALGASWFQFDELSTGALYPTVMFGTERVFGGARWTFLSGRDNDLEETYGTDFPGLVVGASFGRRLIFTPEVNVLFGEETAVLPGASVQLRF